jgi:Ca2+-binding RTX toxin-like protein
VVFSHLAGRDHLTVRGSGGDDAITADESKGAIGELALDGGDGNDALAGGSGQDTLLGRGGNDTLLGKGGEDQLLGSDGNDTLTGGDGDDAMVRGDGGNDKIVWNPGDDTDVVDGGDGDDTVEVNGSDVAETFNAIPNGARVIVHRIDPAPFALDVGTAENVIVNANGGNDKFTATGNLKPLTFLIVSGGDGDDVLAGGNGNDLLAGGPGNDTVTAAAGDDTVLQGAGDDKAIWNPGDGTDAIEGQAGTDVLDFRGANVSEQMILTSSGGWLQLFRDVGNVTVSTNDLEQVRIAALGGGDAIKVGDLSGSEVKFVDVDLAGALGGLTGDGTVDHVTVTGTSGVDNVEVSGSSGAVLAFGLPASTGLHAAEPGDVLTIDTLAGNDLVKSSGLAPGTVQLGVIQ